MTTTPPDTTTSGTADNTATAANTSAANAAALAAAMAIANETNIDLIMINMIRQHQELYDTDENQYKYIDKRDKAWKEVADELGMPGKNNGTIL